MQQLKKKNIEQLTELFTRSVEGVAQPALETVLPILQDQDSDVSTGLCCWIEWSVLGRRLAS